MDAISTISIFCIIVSGQLVSNPVFNPLRIRFREAYGLHGICDDVVHLQHDQSYMGCGQLPVSYWMNL